MSRWSVDPLRIALAPGEAALVRGERQRVLAAPDCRAANLLPLLDVALGDGEWRGGRAEVVLSQQFVRHVLTPAPGKALAAAEERALVAASLREIYGDEAASWKIEVHSQPPKYGLVGAAIEADFVSRLDALLARHGYHSVSILPLATVAARRLPKKMNGWWALVEPGWMSLFGARDGIWQYVSAQPVDDTWAAGLPDLIAREADGDASPTVWVQPLGIGRVTASEAGWKVLPYDQTVRGAVALARA